jgi:hypothetical protein
VHEVRPPFSPENVIDDFCVQLKPFRIRTVTGDKYAGEFPRELFRKRGIQYRRAEKNKSDLYRDLLPKLNSGQIVLPKNDRLVAQLCGLERKTARSGKDSIDHGPGGRDDVCNAVAGACDLIVLAERAQNTGSGGGVYGTFVEPSEIRERIEDELISCVPPDTADHSKPYKGYYSERFFELRQQWEGGSEGERVISELHELRATTGDLSLHEVVNELIKEIKRG